VPQKVEKLRIRACGFMGQCRHTHCPDMQRHRGQRPGLIPWSGTYRLHDESGKVCVRGLSDRRSANLPLSSPLSHFTTVLHQYRGKRPLDRLFFP
jgi:hypothetical protein